MSILRNFQPFLLRIHWEKVIYWCYIYQKWLVGCPNQLWRSKLAGSGGIKVGSVKTTLGRKRLDLLLILPSKNWGPRVSQKWPKLSQKLLFVAPNHPWWSKLAVSDWSEVGSVLTTSGLTTLEFLLLQKKSKFGSKGVQNCQKLITKIAIQCSPSSLVL